jgi:hypothetical protein
MFVEFFGITAWDKGTPSKFPTIPRDYPDPLGMQDALQYVINPMVYTGAYIDGVWTVECFGEVKTEEELRGLYRMAWERKVVTEGLSIQAKEFERALEANIQRVLKLVGDCDHPFIYG